MDRCVRRSASSGVLRAPLLLAPCSLRPAASHSMSPPVSPNQLTSESLAEAVDAGLLTQVNGS